ncbi:MAG: hypothetical protein JWR34_2507 [Mycobacterium sp.]|jgi:hypothetical protein|nr:hypothetical protein [Mycobacterium sp.]
MTNPATMALMVAMLVACLYCARDLWLHGTVRCWLLVALMNFAMIAIHLPASAAHRHGAGLTAVAPVHESTVMNIATVLAAVEVTIAAVVLYYRTRGIRPVETPPSVDGETPKLTAWPSWTIPIGSRPTKPASSTSNRRRSPATR